MSGETISSYSNLSLVNVTFIKSEITMKSLRKYMFLEILFTRCTFKFQKLKWDQFILPKTKHLKDFHLSSIYLSVKLFICSSFSVKVLKHFLFQSDWAPYINEEGCIIREQTYADLMTCLCNIIHENE